MKQRVYLVRQLDRWWDQDPEPCFISLNEEEAVEWAKEHQSDVVTVYNVGEMIAAGEVVYRAEDA